MAQEGIAAAFDVVMDGAEEMVSYNVMNELLMKGYCTVDFNINEDHLENIFREAKSLDRAGRFIDLPVEIADGLLGETGAARLAELPPEDVPEGMQQCDDALTALTQAIALHTHLLGFCTRSRTNGMVLEAAGLVKIGHKAPELVEEHVSRWRATFEKGRLLMLLFMGPGAGMLTLTPIEHQDAKPFKVPTWPGMCMVLRSDILSATHLVSGRKGYVLSSFLLQDGSFSGTSMSPTAEKLTQWAALRLKELSTVGVDDIDKKVAEFNSPTWWRSCYDHTYHACNKIAVRGIAIKFPSTHDPQECWAITVPGADVVTEVPSTRWDVLAYYDPEPDCWTRGKVNCKHGGFMDGADLFDAKFFKISPAEVKGMDPMQRIICDCGYEALQSAGRTKNNLLNSATGVFVAAQMAEITMIDIETEAGGCEQRAAGTGFNTAIMSNRFSFVLGMQGPSIMVDTDASSSLMVLQLGSASCFPGKVMSTMAAVVGIGLMMTPLTWLGRIASGEMTSRHRCFSFDTSASGWVRGDGNGTLAIDNYLDRVNDQLVLDESRYAIGVVSGCTANHVGQSATLNTPSGPATMKCMLETCRNAGIALTSVDAMEAHADGQQFHDAVESMSLRKILCSRGDEDRPAVIFASIRSNMGNSQQATGMASIVKRLYEQRASFTNPTIHLREMNPYLAEAYCEEEQAQPAHFATEALAFAFRTSLVGISGQGFGGTIGSAILTGYANESPAAPRQVDRAECLTFWPGGGGKLEASAMPESGYDIIGSWSSWSKPERMHPESEGVYEYIVTIGVNGSEQFRIVLDGNLSKSLHPGCPFGASGEQVIGPAESQESSIAVEDFFWSIEGSEGLLALEDGADRAEAAEMKDAMAIGDRFRVRLHIAGRWRLVTWERIPDYVAKRTLAQLMQDELIQGMYYVSGPFNNWQFKEMTLQNGFYCTEIKIQNVSDTQFLVVRNQDFKQSFYPDWNANGRAQGPEHFSAAQGSFQLEGVPGDVFRVKFQRTAVADDDKSISFEKVNTFALEDNAMPEGLEGGE